MRKGWIKRSNISNNQERIKFIKDVDPIDIRGGVNYLNVILQKVINLIA